MSHFEGQGQAGVVFSIFDGVDRLAGDGQAFAQLGLRPAPLRSQDSQPIFHLYLQFPQNFPKSHNKSMIAMI